MSNSEAKEVFEKAIYCRSREECDRLDQYDCGICEYYVGNMDLMEAMKTAIEALELCVMIEDDGR